MSTKIVTFGNEITPVPITDYNPLREWQVDSCCLDVFNPQCFYGGMATLITRRCNIFSWIISVIKARNYLLNQLKGTELPCERPVYIKGDSCPSASSFMQMLQKWNSIFSWGQVPIGGLLDQFQDFPLHIIKSHPIADSIIFRWCIVNQEIPPWEDKTNQSSRLENLLNVTGHKPDLIIVDGFSWNGKMKDLKNMLTRLKQRGISTMVLASKFPPNNFAFDSVWDNVLSISPWRNWRCSADNIVLRFQKKNGVKMNIRHHLQSIDGEFWQEKFDGFDFLRPQVALWMRNDKTASQIVDLINGTPYLRQRLKRPMTTANLARLKREWGMRSYKPERKPRKPKTSKTQVAGSSVAQMNSQRSVFL